MIHDRAVAFRDVTWIRARRMLGFVAPLMLLGLIGCSEKGGLYRWDPVHPNGKIALPGLVALSHDEVIAVGYGFPAEGAIALQAVSLRHTAAGWERLPVTGHTGQPFRLLAAAAADDGTIWACGGVKSLDGDLASTLPVMYHYVAGTWTEVSLAEAGETIGAELTAIATGPGGEVRAVGPAASGHSTCFRLFEGHWTRLSYPEPAAASGFEWIVNSVYRSPAGTWYSGGGANPGPSGGVLFEDSGAGWSAIAVPGAANYGITALATDGVGDLWVAGNVPLADSSQGVLFHRTSGGYTQVPVSLARPGTFRIFAIAFGPTGHGWLAGGRSPDDPFFAGNLGGSAWVEILEKDKPIPTPGSTAVKEEGGEIFTIQLLNESLGWASGQAEEFENEGGQEFVPRVFRLALAEEESERGSPGRLTGPTMSARSPR